MTWSRTRSPSRWSSRGCRRTTLRAGFLLDGFPRNVPQAETLQKLLAEWDTKLDIVLELVVDDDEVVRRLSGRRTCRKSAAGSGTWCSSRRPGQGFCDDCGGELFQRDDDQEQTDPAPAGRLRRSRPGR